MKPLRYARLFVALLTASLLSACGGGNENGDLFVSIEQFESGGAGFWIQGQGGDLRVISDGTVQGLINSDIGVGSQMEAPKPVDSSNYADADDIDTDKIIPPGWDNLGKVGRMSRALTGRLESGGMTVAHISSMFYFLEEGSGRGHLRMVFNYENSAQYSSALARFFGCVSNVAYSTGGNNQANAWVDTTAQRVLFPEANGVAIHFWFDFNNGHCLSQMQATTHTGEYTYTDQNGQRQTRSSTGAGAVFTYPNAIFRKTVN